MDFFDIVRDLDQPDPKHLRATVEMLAAFPTRNSVSDGLRPACEALANKLEPYKSLDVQLWEYTLPKGRRVPEDMPGTQVLATLTGRRENRILIGGHIDSLNLQIKPGEGPAPGANDDASGVAVAAELARIFANSTYLNTLCFIAFSGEEQGLLGSADMAARAKKDGWKIDAVLNNDTVGSSSNLSGQKDEGRVRIFSEEADTHNSRELARFAELVIRETQKDFRAKLVFRRDRFGRGGDHTPFASNGFSAVRFIEVHEEFTRQHTPDDRVEFMDFEYLARVASANLAVMASLANANDPPAEPMVKRDQTHDTTITWKASPGVKYVVYHRETTSPVWEGVIPVGEADSHTVKLVNKDDHIFAVGAEYGIPIEAK
ncbi:MAG: M20/M25/M40 family metallo-hydrolase [Fimbriimonadaceae bacterium]|nr:M20/M25/M40 family metallo-hydrolase [Fimbriimonadaceae bacterium]